MSTSSSGKPNQNDRVGFLTVVSEALKHAVDLGKQAMEGAPPTLRVGVWVMFAVFAFGIVFMAIPPYDMTKQLVGLLTIIIALCYLSWFFMKMIPRPGPTPEPKPPTQSPPSPPVSSSSADVGELRPFLENLRQNVLRDLRRQISGIRDEEVRANIFLPTTVKTEKGSKIELRIPPVLCINMKESTEREISFEPGKGATGRAYSSGAVLIVQRNPKKLTGWDETYNVTADQAAIINPKLESILSLPIKVGGKGVVGVANVDILSHRIDYDYLAECAVRASAMVGVMGDFISKANVQYLEAFK
jgi:hypothetical protein